VAELVDISSYHIDMNVSETDISTVQVNQPVDLTFDALPGVTYTGTVTYVNPKATNQQGVVSYLATVTLDPKAAGSTLRAGMSATAAVITNRHSNVLLVPNRAVRTESGQLVVYVIGPGDTQIRVPVQTGLSNDTSTEIVGATPLREGDALVVSGTTASGATRPAGGLINLGGGGRR
jgi:HlyD family secretion protein